MRSHTRSWLFAPGAQEGAEASLEVKAEQGLSLDLFRGPDGQVTPEGTLFVESDDHLVICLSSKLLVGKPVFEISNLICIGILLHIYYVHIKTKIY